MGMTTDAPITSETRPDLGRINAHAAFYAAVRCIEINPVTIDAPGEGEALVRTLWSGLSRGTERLVFNGRVPPGEWERMRAPFQEGAFSFPVKYGYAAVGVVEEGAQDIVGKEVFCLFPHQDRFVAPLSALRPLPAGLPARRAVLAANMETALNAVWDAGIGPGDRIAIVGGGVLGGLIAGICGAIPGTECVLVDVAPQRRALATRMNVTYASSLASGFGADAAFHTSAAEAGLATALDCLGPEGALVELSWYGETAPAAPLGGAFHSQRLRLISSQVGQVAPSRRSRWDYARRLSKALELLCDDKYDALITEEVPFEALPVEAPRLLADGAPGLATAIRYG